MCSNIIIKIALKQSNKWCAFVMDLGRPNTANILTVNLFSFSFRNYTQDDVNVCIILWSVSTRGFILFTPSHAVTDIRCHSPLPFNRVSCDGSTPVYTFNAGVTGQE